jgi:hypothetical protein
MRASSVHTRFSKSRVLIAIGIVVVLALAIFLLRSCGSSSDEAAPKKTAISEAVYEQAKAAGIEVEEPDRLPEGYVRTKVDLLDKATTKTKCPEFFQRFQKSKNSNVDYIDLYAYTSDCAYPRPSDAESFTVGDYAGWISDSDPKLSVLIELTVNQEMVRIETDLKNADITSTFKKFVPASIDVQTTQSTTNCKPQSICE